MNPTLQQPDIKLANEIVKQHNNFYGDVGIGLGSTVNAVTIGVCLYNLFKQELDLKINTNYLRKEKQLSGGFLVLTILLVVVYFIMNYFVIRKEYSKSGWFDWIYFGLSVAILITFLVLTLNLNPCPKFVNTGFGSHLVVSEPT
jgi:hypothetical protein